MHYQGSYIRAIIGKFRDLATDPKLRWSKFKKLKKEVIEHISPVLAKVEVNTAGGGMHSGQIPVMPAPKAIEHQIVSVGVESSSQGMLSLMDGQVSPPPLSVRSESAVSIQDRAKDDEDEEELSVDEECTARHMVTNTL